MEHGKSIGFTSPLKTNLDKNGQLNDLVSPRRSIRPRPLDAETSLPVIIEEDEQYDIYHKGVWYSSNHQVLDFDDYDDHHLVYHNPLISKLQVPIPVTSFVSAYESENKPDFVRPDYYIINIEKTHEELEEIVEYEMDSDDETFLEELNHKKKANQKLQDGKFEKIIDALEKHMWKQKEQAVPEKNHTNEEIVCSVCGEGESYDNNMIVLCDGCDVAVHQMCYGINTIPEEDWHCDLCEQDERDAACALCLQTGGAMKPTTEGEWAHVVCGLWIPGMAILNTETMEPIEGVAMQPKDRFNMVCAVCQKRGACIQCKTRFCYTLFHPSCGVKTRLHMKIRPAKTNHEKLVYECFCKRHTQHNIGQQLKAIQNLAVVDQAELKATVAAVLPSIQSSMKFPANLLERVGQHWIDRRLKTGKPLLQRFRVHIKEAEEKRKRGQGSRAVSGISNDSESFRALKVVRQGMEKVRILLDLIKKREDAKKERIEALKELVELHVATKKPYPKDMRLLFSSNLLSVEENPFTTSFNSSSAAEEKPSGMSSNNYSPSQKKRKIITSMMSDEDDGEDADVSPKIVKHRRKMPKLKLANQIRNPLTDGPSAEVTDQHCHHCKKRRPRCVSCPHNDAHRYCYSCVTRHFNIDFEDLAKDPNKIWGEGCPRCQGTCPCSVCRTLAGKPPLVVPKIPKKSSNPSPEKIRKKRSLKEKVAQIEEKLEELLEENINNTLSDLSSPIVTTSVSEAVNWDVACNVCLSDDQEESLLLCDGCDSGVHTFCLKPPMKVVPQGEWFCKSCKKNNRKRKVAI